MSSTTRDTPDNPYRKGDPWGARPAVPQVFTVQAVPAPMRRVFKPAPETATAPATPRALTPLARSPQERLQLTPVAEPYDEPLPPRAKAPEPTPALSPDLLTARRPPFAGAAPLPTTERPRTPFVGAARRQPRQDEALSRPRVLPSLPPRRPAWPPSPARRRRRVRRPHRALLPARSPRPSANSP